jgi:site-specific DNA-methyltransferase (adenine-specific)
MNINIYNKNYLEGIKKIQPNSIDLILTDIPYNISKENNFKTMKDRQGRNGIDFGEWDKEFNEEDLRNLTPLLKEGGSLVIWSSFEQFNKLQTIFSDLELKDKLIWEKSNPMPRNRDRRYVSNIEICSWYIKKGKWTFNRQNDKYEGSVLKYPSESGGGFKRYHPTQKNLEMIKYLIKIHSNENDLVLDTFLGGGTTAVACHDLNRNFIGFEIDKHYFEVSKNRLQEKIIKNN